MTPADFKLYDALNCLAQAIDEDEAGRPAPALEAWRAAQDAAAGLFEPPACAASAVSVLLAAARPGTGTGPERALLWNALSGASLVVLYAMDPGSGSVALALADTAFAAWLLPDLWRGAVCVLMAETMAMAEAGVAA